MILTLSVLPKTWIFDVDGTIVKHNGHLTKEGDQLLPGVKDFFNCIPKSDVIILLTARKPEFESSLKKFLEQNQIRFDYLLMNMPQGERILINDEKPSGLKMAWAFNKKRDSRLEMSLNIDKFL